MSEIKLSNKTLGVIAKLKSSTKTYINDVTIKEVTVKVTEITAWGDEQRDGRYKIKSVYVINGETYQKV